MKEKQRDESKIIPSGKDPQKSPDIDEPSASGGEKSGDIEKPEVPDNMVGEIESELEGLFEWDEDDGDKDSGDIENEVPALIDEKGEAEPATGDDILPEATSPVPEESKKPVPSEDTGDTRPPEPELIEKSEEVDVEETIDIADLIDSGEIFSDQEETDKTAPATEEAPAESDIEETVDIDDLDDSDALLSLQEEAAEVSPAPEEAPVESDIEETVDIDDLDDGDALLSLRKETAEVSPAPEETPDAVDIEETVDIDDLDDSDALLSLRKETAEASPAPEETPDAVDIEETVDIDDLDDSDALLSLRKEAAEASPAPEETPDAVDIEETVDIDDLDDGDALLSLREEAPAESDIEETVDIDDLDADGDLGSPEKETTEQAAPEPEREAEKPAETDCYPAPDEKAADDTSGTLAPPAARKIAGTGKRFRVLALILGALAVIGLIVALFPLDRLLQKEPAKVPETPKTVKVVKKSPPALPSPTLTKQTPSPAKPPPPSAESPPPSTAAPSAATPQDATVKSTTQTVAEPTQPADKPESEKDAPAEAVVSPASKEKENPAAEIEAFLTIWKAAWEKSAGPEGDMTTYMSLYSEDFHSKGFDRRGWETFNADQNKQKEWIRVVLQDIEVQGPLDKHLFEARFRQEYASSDSSDVSKQTLVLRKEPSGWKIIGTEWPVRILHPWSIHAASYVKRVSAEQKIAAYRRQGLAAFWVKANLGKKKGVWYRVFVGHFTGEEAARKVISEQTLQDARPMKTAYAVLIGTFNSEAEAESRNQALAAKGYSPYVIRGPFDMFHLYAGAFVYRKSADRLSAELNAKGVHAGVVER
jgi:SPOR domain